MKTKHIVLGITGSIAAYKACELISLFRKANFSVSCVLTKEAAEFITPLTLEVLSGNKVLEDMFSLPDNRTPAHISLADTADLVVICPATANIIGKLASGVCDDFLCCTVISTKAPVLIAPAMNNNMFKHKIVQKNIATLKEIDYRFIGPVKGHLACGYEAIGHLAEISDIFKESKKLIKR
ncbi:MAG: hypothetical protein HQ579_00130 [Candidatus Omnitrophica bacterium]|nr:hypothetical protein [Candidatus Omnitrophota bacterium]